MPDTKQTGSTSTESPTTTTRPREDHLRDSLSDPLAAVTGLFRGPVARKPGAPPPNGSDESGSSLGSGGSIPYKSDMEASFGKDFSGIKSYTGRSTEMGAMNAHAATDGRSVMFASVSPNKETVAHEMAHVAQSMNAGTSTLQAKPLVSDTSSAAEREADEVAPKVARGEHVTVSAAPAAVVSRRAYARLPPTQKAQVDAKAESDYYQAAGQFEVGLGKELAQSSDANDAAKAMSKKVAKMVDVWARKLALNADEQYVACFGQLDKSSTGFVLPVAEDIRAVIKSGSLRERLTLIYSAIRHGYLPKMLQTAYLEVSGKLGDSFKTKLHGQVQSDQVRGFAQRAGLKRHIRSNQGLFETGNGVAKVGPNEELDGRSALFNRGEAISREERSGEKQFTLGTAPDGARGSREKNINLSERELRAQLKSIGGPQLSKAQAKREAKRAKLSVSEYLKRQMVEVRSNQTGKNYDPNTNIALTWTPGETYYKAQVDGKISEAARKTKTLLRASISGSTDMLMNAARYLGMTSTKDLKKVRLAMLAWMLPARDHSFWEIMASAAQFGLTDFDPNVEHGWLGYETAISPASKNYNKRARNYINNPLHPKKDVYPGHFLGHGTVKPPYKDNLAANWLPGSGLAVREGPEVERWVSRGLPRGTVESLPDPAFAALGALYSAVGHQMWLAMRTGANDTVMGIVSGLPQFTALVNGGARAGDVRMIAAVMAKHWLPTADLGEDGNALAGAADLMKTMGHGERSAKYDLGNVDVDTHNELRGKRNTKSGVLTRNRKAFTKDVLEHDPDAYRGDADRMNAWFEIMQRRGYTAFMSRVRFEQLQQLNNARKQAVGTPQEAATELAFQQALDADWQVTGLTEAEQTAVYMYTISAEANKANEGIRNKDTTKLKGRQTGNQLLLSAMEKMRPYTSGPVYRGDGDRGFQVGGVVHYQEFVSTAKTVKSSFINHTSKDWCTQAVVIDNHRSGKDLMGFSSYSDASFATIEGEVLFPPGSRFVVKRIVDWSGTIARPNIDRPSQRIKNDLKLRDQLQQRLAQADTPQKAQPLMDALAQLDLRIQNLHPGWKDEVRQAKEREKGGGHKSQNLAKRWIYMDEI